jgi:hypothetical protein
MDQLQTRLDALEPPMRTVARPPRRGHPPRDRFEEEP